MTDRQFTILLRKATRIASEAQAIQGRLTDAFRDRYGQTYSDVDCDPLIDSLDYGGGDHEITAEDADRLMAE